MKYFGTHPFHIGHYIWSIEHFFDRDSKTSWSLIDQLNFYGHKSNPKGTVVYDQVPLPGSETIYTLIYISGSAYDTRNGTVSVFFKEGRYTYEEMCLFIQANQQAMTIIDIMPFEVNFKNPIRLNRYGTNSPPSDQ